MLDPSKRFVTLVLILGIVVLGVAIAVGEEMGNRVVGQVVEKRLTSIAPVTVTPEPSQTTAPYGPGWQRSRALSAATDPGFPDPRVPPVPLPTIPPATPTPRPAPTPAPAATPTPNMNLPIWRRNAPLPVATPVPSASPGSSLHPSPSASPHRSRLLRV